MLRNAGYGQSNHVQPSICEASHKSTVITLGRAITVGEHLQYTVPAETWFASRPAAGVPFSLVGCTVSPGFDFNDFEMGSREALLNDFPNDHEAILALTRS